MHSARAILVLAVSFISGCGSREVTHRYVPSAPDLAIYDGVYFESKNGMKTYSDIVLIPRLLRNPVPLLLPDGKSVDVRDISADVLRTHNIGFELHQDNGKGTYNLTCIEGLYVSVIDGRAVSVVLFTKTTGYSPFSIQFKGHTIAVPIKRVGLEALLGEPDEIKMDTWPNAHALTIH